MQIPNLLNWWRSLPTKTRVRLIACVFLALAGTEVLFIAPHILELAAMIDALGFAFVAGAIATSIKMWCSQVKGLIRRVVTISRSAYDHLQAGLSIVQEAIVGPAFILMRFSRSVLYWSSVAACSTVFILVLGKAANVLMK